MSLTLGLIAALAWGIHDLCVRHVSQTTGIFASIVTVLAFGCLLVGPVSLFAWGEEMGANALPCHSYLALCSAWQRSHIIRPSLSDLYGWSPLLLEPIPSYPLPGQ